MQILRKKGILQKDKMDGLDGKNLQKDLQVLLFGLPR